MVKWSILAINSMLWTIVNFYKKIVFALKKAILNSRPSSSDCEVKCEAQKRNTSNWQLTILISAETNPELVTDLSKMQKILEKLYLNLFQKLTAQLTNKKMTLESC